MFRVGQKIVCISEHDILGRDTIVKKGQVVTVASTFLCWGQAAVTLVEIDHNRLINATGWAESLFRPATDISMFTEMLKKTKIPEDA
jgi:hypothetical protein